jgi:hypothetical protein
MGNQQAAVVFQEPDDDHPAEIAIPPLDYDFASVFNTLFPDIKCSHCFAQMRLLFYAGVISADAAYASLDKIRSDEHLDAANKWYQDQVEEARQELSVEITVAGAEQTGCMHDESTGYH